MNEEEINDVGVSPSTGFLVMLATITIITVPFLDGLNAIIMKRMKGINERTVSCYVNPVQFMVMLIIILSKGSLE